LRKKNQHFDYFPLPPFLRNSATSNVIKIFGIRNYVSVAFHSSRTYKLKIISRHPLIRVLKQLLKGYSRRTSRREPLVRWTLSCCGEWRPGKYIQFASGRERGKYVRVVAVSKPSNTCNIGTRDIRTTCVYGRVRIVLWENSKPQKPTGRGLENTDDRVVPYSQTRQES